MEITFKKAKVTVDCQSGDRVKLYTVPAAYSEDELYLAHWRYGQVEPMPACAGREAELLADLTIVQEGETQTATGYRAEGVTVNA
ncbi:MAG: hypothetical protein IJU65_04265 [Desulfovibrio sp.]|nr:hypothetical protein [Desulfovibrio sp.]